MKTIERKVYVALDGTEFASAAECKRHERDNASAQIVGLTAEQVAAAIDRSNLDLGEAIERVGNLIATARKAAGDLKRRPRGEEAAPGLETETPPDVGEPESEVA